MKRIIAILLTAVVWSLPAAAQTASSATDNQGIQNQIDQLKQSLAALQQQLEDQQKAAQAEAAKKQEEQKATEKESVSAELKADIKDLDHRVALTERKSALDRLNWGGDFRFEAHSIYADIPQHFDGLALQNLIVKTIFYMQTTGAGSPPGICFVPNSSAACVSALQSNVNGLYGQYLGFTNNLTFNPTTNPNSTLPAGLRQTVQGFANFGAPGQTLLQNLAAATFAPKTNANNNILYTSRLRLNFDAKVAENVSMTARLSMYKVWGDSTGVQVFNGQPNSINLDGTTANVPSGDFLRVERAYFTWNQILGSPLYVSIGRRPSTEGYPINLRHDEPRGGTPSSALIDYQFDGITVGYHVGEKMAFRICYGLGYESGFGNGFTLPQDRLKDTHFLGINADLYSTDKTLVQFTAARAYEVPDGFNGLVVLPANPLTGDPINAPVVLRFTPSANLGNINLYGLTAGHQFGPLELFASGNWTSLKPNGNFTPFGGMGSDPFDPANSNHEGHMVYAGARYSVPANHGATKLGVEFNQGSKYWFNFAQAQDDIFAPKTNTRGEVYEAYITHRINPHFSAKLDYEHYNYTYSGSGFPTGAPKRLDSVPTLGFPTYDHANVITFGMDAKF